MTKLCYKYYMEQYKSPEKKKLEPKEIKWLENKEAEEKRKEEDKKINGKMSRREFLKGTAAVIVGASIGGGLSKLSEFSGEKAKKENKEHEKRSEGTIIKKNSIPLKKYDDYQYPLGNRTTYQFEKWEITLNIFGKENSFFVSKDEFDSYDVGEKINIVYDDRDMQVKSVSKK